MNVYTEGGCGGRCGCTCCTGGGAGAESTLRSVRGRAGLIKVVGVLRPQSNGNTRSVFRFYSIV